ncbi:serine protease Do-like HtrB [Ruminiclostridium hungatei]|uniref:Serine protease Do-like HtrB n=1 Tax=Ruminiclostridium hungatei TaxID=48256 RepID=A0A1V4SHZ8_RUMHU|nr:trypsin-like peptidase domain-containing protein [Ruminiclostridium hungatei]OPX43424.1 serine protease Do-like HtrB [Ruminiclostridium hungatei]
MFDDKNEKNDATTELNNRLNDLEENEVKVQREENSSDIYKSAETNSAGEVETADGDTAHASNAETPESLNADMEDKAGEKTTTAGEKAEADGLEATRPFTASDGNQGFVPQPDRVNQSNFPGGRPVNGPTSMNDTQRVWPVYNSPQGNITPQNMGGQNYNNYYRENYKNTQKKSEAWKYILVSVVSSIIGGAILTVMLLGVGPMVQPELKSFFGSSLSESAKGSQTQSGELKRVEIVQTAESAVTSVAEKVGPSVVGIRTTYQNTNDLFGVQSEGGEGSGIIISSDGYILTNHHVIENALNDKTRKVQLGSKIEVFLPNKIDKGYTAEVKGYDSKTDLAVLKINETNLNAIEFGNSDDLKIGEPAIAIGNPGGLEYMGSVTQGVISGLNRTVQLDGGRKIKLVQTDAAINPGNSGGALVNIKGQLIGVNTVKMVATGFEGLGFAIPVNDAKRISDELIKNTYIPKPYLGITVDQRYTEDFAKDNKMPMGVYVADIELLGAAEKAGIQAGDVITKFAGKTVKSFAELEDEKNKHKPGDTVSIEIYREGNTKTVQVKLGETK